MYTDLHRGFVQVMLSRSVIAKKELRGIISTILESLEADGQAPNEDTVIEEINNKIKNMRQEITTIKDERSGETFVVLVNNHDYSKSEKTIRHSFTKEQREVFRRILELFVIHNTNGAVSTTDILNLDITDFRPGLIEDLLHTFIAEGWFVKGNRGEIFLSPRSLAEFGFYFKTNYSEDVETCPCCTNVIFHGIHCERCKRVIHRHCFAAVGRGNKCPNCKTVISAENNDTPNGNGVTGSKKLKKSISTESLHIDSSPPEEKQTKSSRRKRRSRVIEFDSESD